MLPSSISTFIRTRQSATGVCENFGQGACIATLNAFESWMFDASRAQREWPSFFNHGLDKDTAIVAGVPQCASTATFADLQVDFLTGLANDDAELAKKSLRWQGETTQHALDETGNAGSQTEQG
ncbi:hypothetical protein [Dyella japonica]|uniref:Uncharacterized protein n=1 Tax=Dyella japonica TaxID=231455 RepID=A0ABV2JP31_9GAMM